MPSTKSTFARNLKKVLKPLTQAEAKRAVQATIDHLKPELVRGEASRFRVIGAEIAITRPKEREAIPIRQIEVLVVDYLNRRHVRSVVEEGRVVEARTLDYQPAISSEEIVEATELVAAADPDFKKLARRKGVFVSHYAPGQIEAGARRIGLYFLSTGRDGLAQILATAEVDLVEQKVLAVRSPGQAPTTQTEGGRHGGLR